VSQIQRENTCAMTEHASLSETNSKTSVSPVGYFIVTIWFFRQKKCRHTGAA
jgi:hypothetical protein